LPKINNAGKVLVMKNFWIKLEKTADVFLGKPIGILDWSFLFLGIIAVRLFLDNFIAKNQKVELGTVNDVHNVLFFLMMMVSVWIFLNFLIKKNSLKLANLMIWSALLLILPPIFDLIKTGGNGVFWSSYLLSDIKTLFWQFITIFGHLPSGIMYFGTKIVFISAIILCSGFVFLKTKSFFKAISSLLGVYAILFFMASFPSFLAYIYYFFVGTKRLQDVSMVNIIQLFLSPNQIFGLKEVSSKYYLEYNLNLIYFPCLIFVLYFLFLKTEKIKMLAFLNNLRIPQVFYHWGLFLIGLGCGFLAYPDNFNLNSSAFFAVFCLIISIFLAWESSVIFNDLVDLEIDRVSNQKRPLIKEIFTIEQYKELGIILFFLSLLGGLVVNIAFFYLFLVYQILAWFYSAKPFRIKRFPIVATFLSGIASLIIVFTGFALFSGEQNIQGLSWRIIWLLLITFTLSLPLKDFKDIEGDKKNGIWTMPVIFGEEKGRLIVGSGIFISFVLSVFFLNELKLFWWALIFGIFSFWIINNKKIKPRSFSWWFLGVVFIYIIVLVKIVFL